MAITPGTRLGPYEVLAKLGEGGMGEVYRGRDTKLDRDVAIKILPEAFAADPERLVRFEREAKTLASLNHPHIAQVFGLESHAIIMELVEGKDLAELIAEHRHSAPAAAGPSESSRRGTAASGGGAPRAMSLEDAVSIARQIAEGLEAAHEAGVIHRDLKPANVKVRADGTVKVLDFGLARTLDPGPGTQDASNSPTLTAAAFAQGYGAPGTQIGMIIGTAAYMAPEQAKGKPVDKRADVWAFGCVVYELLTGRRPFLGDDVSETLAAVLRQDVDWTALPPETPPRLRRLLERCLDRDAKQRLRDIGEARVELAKIETGVPDAGLMAVAGPAAAPRASLKWLWLGTAGVLLAGVAAYAGYRLRPVAEAPVVRFTIVPPENSVFIGAPLLSPDGRLLAFLADTKGTRHVWVRPIDATEARPLAGTEGADISLFWAPDSRSIGFFADGKMRRIPVAGGPAQTIADVTDFSGASWSVNGVVLYAPTATSPVYVVPAGGGTPAAVTTLDAAAGERSHRWPSFLPDGRRFLYYARHPGSKPEGVIMLSSLDNPSRRTEVLKANAHAVYAVTAGVLVFLSDRTLMAQAFDVASATLSGDPVVVADDVGAYSGRVGIGRFSVSDAGTLAYSAGGEPQRQLVWRDRRGKELSRLLPEGVYFEPRLSPGDSRAAVGRFMSNNSDVWIFDLARSLPSRFTFGPHAERSPVWSPDGSRIVFASYQSSGGDLYVRPSNGSAPEELLFGTPGLETPSDWSPDGTRVLFHGSPPSDIFALPLTGARTPQPVVTGPAHEWGARFSPDGQWIAYTSDESTREEIYLQNLTRPGGKVQISTDGGRAPMWGRDGRELYYDAPDGTLMAVPIRNGTVDGLPIRLFQTPSDPLRLEWRMAASADGQKFLVNTPVDTKTVTPVTVVMNWIPKKAGRE